MARTAVPFQQVKTVAGAWAEKANEQLATGMVHTVRQRRPRLHLLLTRALRLQDNDTESTTTLFFLQFLEASHQPTAQM
jgi:hypothetical protein